MRSVFAALTATMALVALTVAIGLAQAAGLQEHQDGMSCPDGATGVWHFVNVQTGGGSSTLTAVFSTGTAGPVDPIKVNKNSAQWNVTHDGVLQSVSTSLGGFVVVSDLTCDSTPPPPPPPPPPA